MDPQTFSQLLTRHGPDLAAWPPRYREAAQRLHGCDTAIRAELAAARRLDGLLATTGSEALRAAEADAPAVIDVAMRRIAALPQRQGPWWQPWSWGEVMMGLLPPQLLTPRLGLVLAATVLAGWFAGIALPDSPAFAQTGGEPLLSALLDNPAGGLFQ